MLLPVQLRSRVIRYMRTFTARRGSISRNKVRTLRVDSPKFCPFGSNVVDVHESREMIEHCVTLIPSVPLAQC